MTEATSAAAALSCPEPGARVPRSPATVDLTITNRCNLRCRYCSHFSSAADVGRDLPTEAWLALFRELGEIAVMDVVLSGGEPFIREDIRTLIDGIVAHRMRFSALSNGTLIDDALAAFLKGTGRCGHVQVSIDGSGPDAHDFARGDGSFAKAMAGLKALRRHGVPAAVRVTIHRRNLDDLPAIAAMLLDEVGLVILQDRLVVTILGPIVGFGDFLAGSGRQTTDIQLTRDDIGDQPCAVLADEVDLPLGLCHRQIQTPTFVSDCVLDLFRFVSRRNGEHKIA